MTPEAMHAAVRDRVAAVDDPEFPGVSITDLGIVEAVRVDAAGRTAEVDLVPTFLGCPALEVIASDVRSAAVSVPGVDTVSVRFLSEPAWTRARISARGRRRLAAQFAVAVAEAGTDAGCPVCGVSGVEIRSPFGPTPCRSIAYCSACRNPVEVMRG